MKRQRVITRHVLSGALFVVVFGILLYAGLRAHPVPQTFHEEDKLYHVLGFAALVVSARVAFPRIRWWQLVLAALVVGAGIEFLQDLEPARTGSVWDFVFDMVGITAGWLVLYGRTLVLRRWRA